MSQPRPLHRRRILLSTAAAAGLAAPWAWAQNVRGPGGYPSKPVRVVVAFPPGGLTDAYARLFADTLAAKTGQTVVVENKPGAGAIIAIEAVAKAPPDGLTLLMTTSGTVWQNRVLYNKLPYNLEKDITPVAVYPSGPLVVAVNEKVPARNWKEFVAWAKTAPNVNMGSYAPGSYPHMVADQTNRQDGTKMQSIHYRGEAPMWVDVVSGQVQVAIGSYQAFNTVSTRGVRPIGVTGNYRSPKLPDVPTLVEQGVKDILVSLEGGLPLIAPAGTPENILRFLSDVVVEGNSTERAVRLRENFAIPSSPKALDATRRDWDREVPVWINVAQGLGIKLD